MVRGKVELCKVLKYVSIPSAATDYPNDLVHIKEYTDE